MGKQSSDIIKWGVVKPFFDKSYKFNSIDIETIDNELFILGFTKGGIYNYVLADFYNTFHDYIIDNIRAKTDILTWSRYDNTHLIKLILSKETNPSKVLLRIGKISPIYEYQYKGFTFEIKSIIKDSIIFKVTDRYGKSRYTTIYNLKNLYISNLETTARDYNIDWYSKLGTEYHLIDKKRFETDKDYRKMVLYSNELDNKVLIEIGYKFIDNFKKITGVYPKSIFTAGSVARSYLLAYNTKENPIPLQFKSIFNNSKKRDLLLDYSMKAYHGGKIESYVLGYIKKGFIIDITSAYPSVLKKLPKLTNKIYKGTNTKDLDKYFYAFIKCNITINDPDLIHPIIMENPINMSNISPYGYLKDIIITKLEYDYMIKKGCKIEVIDYIAVEHENIYPYETLVDDLFHKRLQAKKEKNNSLADLFKTIINSLYGITYELTDIYKEIKDDIVWQGFRAGDYFNPVIASYITAGTRAYLSEVSHNIIELGGEVYLNMTDSIIYNGKVSLPVFSEVKTLGMFEKPEQIKDIMILGAGRYEYKKDFNDMWVIKNRGFSVSVKDKSFYSSLDLKSSVKIKHRTFVTSFKATTNKYNYKQMGHLIDDDYIINPFNLGGKRVIENYHVDLKTQYTKTLPIKIEKDYYKT